MLFLPGLYCIDILVDIEGGEYFPSDWKWWSGKHAPCGGCGGSRIFTLVEQYYFRHKKTRFAR